MGRLSPAAVLALALLGAAPAQALSGKALLDSCEAHLGGAEVLATSEDAFNRGARSGNCIGYIYGVLEAQAGGGEGDERPRRFCPPAGEDAGRVVGRVIRHLQDHPESLDGPAARVVAEALGQAYPCGD